MSYLHCSLTNVALLSSLPMSYLRYGLHGLYTIFQEYYYNIIVSQGISQNQLIKMSQRCRDKIVSSKASYTTLYVNMICTFKYSLSYVEKHTADTVFAEKILAVEYLGRHVEQASA